MPDTLTRHTTSHLHLGRGGHTPDVEVRDGVQLGGVERVQLGEERPRAVPQLLHAPPAVHGQPGDPEGGEADGEALRGGGGGAWEGLLGAGRTPPWGSQAGAGTNPGQTGY